jgi:hypothetical protein
MEMMYDSVIPAGEVYIDGSESMRTFGTIGTCSSLRFAMLSPNIIVWLCLGKYRMCGHAVMQVRGTLTYVV